MSDHQSALGIGTTQSEVNDATAFAEQSLEAASTQTPNAPTASKMSATSRGFGVVGNAISIAEGAVDAVGHAADGNYSEAAASGAGAGGDVAGSALGASVAGGLTAAALSAVGLGGPFGVAAVAVAATVGALYGGPRGKQIAKDMVRSVLNPTPLTPKDYEQLEYAAKKTLDAIEQKPLADFIDAIDNKKDFSPDPGPPSPGPPSPGPGKDTYFGGTGPNVNGGVKTCHWGGAKAGQFGVRALERVALK